MGHFPVMNMIGIIGGVAFSESRIFKDADVKEIETSYGPVKAVLTGNITFIPRHGIESKIPPHKINHLANISAFNEKGIARIIGVNSVGSLKTDIEPPSILIPHDYINLWEIATYYNDKIVHIVPGLDENLRQDLVSSAGKSSLKVLGKGIYVQTTGPRLETKAEIGMLANFGDVVGMTMASEATLSKELGLSYASICSVDNYAHGIVEEPLTSEIIIKNARANGERIGEFLLGFAEEMK